jgi:hypothetical protein
LTNNADGSEAACLKVDLSNGQSTRWKGVSWGLGGLALGFILIGAIGGIINLTLNGPVERGRAKERLVSYMLWLQFVTSLGMLSIDYPSLFTAFCDNFAWAMGFIYVKEMQLNLQHLRNHTGGNLTQLAGELNLVGGTEAVTTAAIFDKRSLALPAPSTNIALAPDFDLMKRVVDSTARLVQPVIRLASANTSTAQVNNAYAVPTVQNTDTANTVSLGIPRFLVPLTISPYQGFLTTFLWFLIVFAVFLALVLVLAIPAFFITRKWKRQQLQSETTGLRRGLFYSLVRANALRLLLICWYPLLVMSMYQWTIGQNDAWSAIVLSVLTVVFTTASLLFLAVRTIILVRRQGSPQHVLSPGKGGHTTPFWNMFKESCWWMFFPLGVITFARACFLVFPQATSGWVQTVALTVLEVIALALMILWRPFTKKSSNGMNIIIQILRCIVSGALIAFNPSIGLNQIVRTVIGAVLAVICSVVVIFFLILAIIDAVKIVISIFKLVRARRQAREQYAMGGGAAPVMQQWQRSDDDATLAGSQLHAGGSGEKVLQKPRRSRFSQFSASNTDDSATAVGSAYDHEGKLRNSHRAV